MVFLVRKLHGGHIEHFIVVFFSEVVVDSIVDKGLSLYVPLY